MLKTTIMTDFEVNRVGTNSELAEFRALATLALHALRRGRTQIMGALVQEDQDFAIQQLEKFLKNHN
jgi:hypothetical protein